MKQEALPKNVENKADEHNTEEEIQPSLQPIIVKMQKWK